MNSAAVARAPSLRAGAFQIENQRVSRAAKPFGQFAFAVGWHK
jgi:hypothetical protein